MYKQKNKKIIILVPENIKPGWYSNIYNPELGVEQCTGDSIHNIIDIDNEFGYDHNIHKKVKKTITKF